MQEFDTCGDLVEGEGTTVTINEDWAGCYVRPITQWACPRGGPCSEVVGTVLERCEDSGACDLYREVVSFIRDRIPPIVCFDPVCPGP